MAIRVEEENAEISANSASVRNYKRWVTLFLRAMAVFATLSAAIVMGLNKESKDFVFATTGNTPVTVTLQAKFQHTPAFVFFVVANGIACFHNMMMIIVDFFGNKFDCEEFRFAIIAILDMIIVGVVAVGDGGAVFMAELGRNGNKHARWNKICDNFSTFCSHGGGALISSFIALFLLLLISSFSILNLIFLKPKPNPNPNPNSLSS